MDSAEYYDRIGATGERDPREFDKKCEDCGHMVSNHGKDGCCVPGRTYEPCGRTSYEPCGCTSYEWADDDE